jgi:hypothetical protein
MEFEVVKTLGEAAIFFWLYWDTKTRLQQQQDKHDQDIKQVYDQRVQDLKILARLPTDLEGTPMKAVQVSG